MARMYMVLLHPHYIKLTTQNIPALNWPVSGLSSAACSESTYLMMAERPKRVVDITNRPVYTTIISTNVNQKQIDADVSLFVYCAKVFRYMFDLQEAIMSLSS
jgi:hypothetical protein